MELIREVGAFAGLAAFFGLALLALLYFAQARDVRRLRENAEFLVEGEAVNDRAEEPIPAAVAAQEPAEAARAAAASAPNDAEAFRRAELARQAAERRRRFEERRRGERRGAGEILGSLPSTAVVLVGAVILLAGVGFGATRLLGGDETEGGGGGGGARLACPPAQTKVAVLNGTAEAGLAASFAQRLRQANYGKGPVTNTETGFDRTVVMFGPESQQCAGEVGNTAGLSEAPAEPMSQEITQISEGSAVAVVLGEDVATDQTGADSSAATAGAAGAVGD